MYSLRQGNSGRIFMLLMALTLIAGLLMAAPLAAVAEEPAGAGLSAGVVTGAPGETITVPITMTSEGNVAGLQFDLSYDESQLTLTSVAKAGSLTATDDEGEPIYTRSYSNVETNRVRVVIFSGTNTLIPSGASTIVNIKFKVADGLTDGKTCVLELSNVVLTDINSDKILPLTLTNGQFTGPAREATKDPGGSVADAVFYIAVQDSDAGETKYYYYTRADLEAYETQEAYTYNDHSVMKTVTCKGALLKDLLNDLKGVTITGDMIVQYSEQDAYHADPNTAVIDSNYKDTVQSLTESTLSGSGSTKAPMRSIVTYLIHEEYENPDQYNVNDPAGVFKDADNNTGYLRAYRDTGGANSAVIKYLMGAVVSKSGSLLTQDKGVTVSCVSAKNPSIKIVSDSLVQGLLPGMEYAVKAPVVTNAVLAAGQTTPEIITVGSGGPAAQVITFSYDEDPYFYVQNSSGGTTTNYTYSDLVSMSTQTPDAAVNAPPYGYSRPMYYRYNGVWLSDLLDGLSGEYIINLVAKDGSKTDITDDVDLYFAAYNNTQSKSSTNIPEGKRVTKTYNDAKIIIPGTGENITGSGSTDYTTAGKDVDVLVAEAEGMEISISTTPPGEEVAGSYQITPVTDDAYENSATASGITTMTVRPVVVGMKYFSVQVVPVIAHDGTEAVVFVHLRNGIQSSLNVTKADFDGAINDAQAGFNVREGDVVKSYIVDDLTNDTNFSPTILQD